MQQSISRLHVRPVMASDADDLFRIYGDPATNTFNPSGPYPNREYAQTVLDRWITHWQQHRFGNWAISLLTAPDTIIGFGGLSRVRYADLTINNLGYRFATDAWGKGLATEFSAYAIRHGFTRLNLKDISAVVRSNHLASQRVLQKAGLEYCGEIDDVKDAPPSWLYSLSREAWRQSQ